MGSERSLRKTITAMRGGGVTIVAGRAGIRKSAEDNDGDGSWACLIYTSEGADDVGGGKLCWSWELGWQNMYAGGARYAFVNDRDA